MTIAFVALAFVLGIWVGTGWFAAIVRKQRVQIEETESRINKFADKMTLLIDRRKQELIAQESTELEAERAYRVGRIQK